MENLSNEQDLDQFSGTDQEDLSLPSVNIKLKGDAYEVFEQLVYKRPRVNRIVQLWLTGCYNTAEIADIIGVSKECVMRWLRRKEIKEYISLYQQDAMDVLKAKMNATSELAFNKMVKLTESNMDNVALQACKDILDRTGYKAKQEIEQNITIKTYEEQLRSIIDATTVDYEVVDDE